MSQKNRLKITKINWIKTIIFLIFCMPNPKDRRKETLQRMKEQQETQKIIGNRYKIQNKVGNGVSSVVMLAIDLRTKQPVAIKKIKQFLENKHESIRILREILLLRRLNHPNIIKLKQIIVEDQECKDISLVLQYCASDIKRIFRSNRTFSFENIKIIIFQLLCGLKYCQECQVLHRDLKPQNILVNENYSEVKLCDFGLARAVIFEELNQEAIMEEKTSPSNPRSGLSAHVTTRWYRAPELILLERKYSSAIDMWSVGCILGQLLSMIKTNNEHPTHILERKPLFPGKACYPLSPPKSADMNYKKVNDFPHSVHDQLSVIFSILGTPDDISFISDERARNYIKSFGKISKRPFEEIFHFLPPEAEDFLQKALQINPSKRMSVSEAINHKLFDSVRPKYEANMSIKGEPIQMELQNLTIPQIKELAMKEYQYYQQKNENIMQEEH